MLEKTIEAALVKRVKDIGGMAEKFTSPNKRSVPDRLITMPNGHIVFVEVKSPKGKLTPLQEKDHAIRRGYGCDVRVINSMEQAHAFPE